MKSLTRSSRWTAGLITAALLVATLVPVAQADRGGSWIRYKRGGPSYTSRVVRYDYAPRRVYVEHSSSIAPALIGFIGGLVVGSSVHSHPVYVSEAPECVYSPPVCAPPPPEYEYWDPYCHESFVSLDAYSRHAWHEGHPRMVRVIEVGRGDCVRSMIYEDGRWCDRAPNFQVSWSQGCDDRDDEDWRN